MGGCKPAVDYHKLPPPVGIVCVDTAELHEAAMKELSSCPVIGLDAEWRPYFGVGQMTMGMAVLQMAVREKVFLFDIRGLPAILRNPQWTSLKDVFTGPMSFGF